MKKALKIVLIAVALLSINSTVLTPVSAASSMVVPPGDMTQQVIAYLTARGYTNVQVVQITQQGNYICSSSYPYLTIVYIQRGQIVGSEDMD